MRSTSNSTKHGSQSRVGCLADPFDSTRCPLDSGYKSACSLSCGNTTIHCPPHRCCPLHPTATCRTHTHGPTELLGHHPAMVCCHNAPMPCALLAHTASLPFHAPLPLQWHLLTAQVTLRPKVICIHYTPVNETLIRVTLLGHPYRPIHLQIHWPICNWPIHCWPISYSLHGLLYVPLLYSDTPLLDILVCPVMYVSPSFRLQP